MYVRCAYFIGRPVAGKQKELDEQLLAVVDLYPGFPGLRWANMMLSKEPDDGTPDIYATVQFCFDSPEALAQALDTPHRQVVRDHYAKHVLPLFEGTIKHVNQEVNSIFVSA